eukprot:CAMPEP_0204909028 /NCGR_PEP_ID=MMETSP1397-20131031/7840_1 /ASSEMBLY_ACC=CAM_ASM_000891 /TAXON_ID=49980 /ORGANISM="Climacostomum Climacostomum virens, Strain Stock W-24" /LENGTH=448 /DNA_ID=CAMNT_0052078745 /DNA_START=5 /DNA_END=1351 /DNA_ORIENTATION=+
MEASVRSLEQRVEIQQSEAQQSANLLQLVTSLSALLNYESTFKANKRKLQLLNTSFRSIGELLDEIGRLLENYADRKAKGVADFSRRKDLELKKVAARVKSAEGAAQQIGRPKDVIVKEFQVLLNEETQSILNYVIDRLQDIQRGLKQLVSNQQDAIQGQLQSEQAKLELALEDLRHFQQIQGARLERVKPASSRQPLNREQIKREILSKAQDRLRATVKQVSQQTLARCQEISKSLEAKSFEARQQVEEAEDWISKQTPPQQSEENQLKASNESTRLMVSHMSSFTGKTLEGLKQQAAELEIVLSSQGVDLASNEPRLTHLKSLFSKFSTRVQATCYRIEGNLKANTDLFNKLNRSSPDRSIVAEQPKLKRLSEEYQLVKQAIQSQLEGLSAYLDKLSGFFPKVISSTTVINTAIVPKAAVISEDEELDEGSFDDFSDEDEDEDEDD